ncbi:hypothetical protein [Microbacterium sp. CIAB417]|uniref:hypothetical protein n=1 Tax=Microbacterium sp. CIAB417 TaxID=2860287 RepID=UPI001FACCA18|nr:hypothetical protein [Microbacterium sp. CIAB417]
MVSRRRWFASFALGLLAVTGCSALPVPEPTQTTDETVTQAPSPTPSTEPAYAPEAAFQLPCDDVVYAMTDLFGIPSAPVTEHLAVQESPNWYPGPAQYMFQRAGGVVCGYDDGETRWQVTAVSGAGPILEELAANGYDAWDESSRCGDGRCTIVARDGDILVEAAIVDSALTAADLDRTYETMTALAGQAAATVKDVEIVPSAIAGAECEHLLSPDALAELWDVPAQLESEFGGWGIPASVYWTRDGGNACVYLEAPGSYEGEFYLTLTTLPAGRWAAELPVGRTAVDVDGADSAYAGEDDYYENLPFVDIVVGDDWVRISAPDRTAEDLLSVAPVVAANMAALGS